MKSSDPRAERERAEATLAAIDAAVEDGRAEGDGERERELGQLALTLRAGAPQPSASFAADLEERVWAGFAESEGNGSAAARHPPRDRTLAGGGAAPPREPAGARRVGGHAAGLSPSEAC